MVSYTACIYKGCVRDICLKDFFPGEELLEKLGVRTKYKPVHLNPIVKF